MRFTEQEIAAAQQLRELGLPWTPQPGHFVLDMTGFCKAGSPFQDRVYFILNYDYFIGKVGGVDEFKRIMLWLPAWHDAREILRSMNVSDKKVAEFLQSQRAVEDGTELLALYEMIKACLAHEAAAANNEAVVT